MDFRYLKKKGKSNDTCYLFLNHMDILRLCFLDIKKQPAAKLSRDIFFDSVKSSIVYGN